MKKKLSEYSFLLISFFLGWLSLYGNVLSFLLIPLIIINILADTPSFVKNIKQGKWYLGVPCMFVFYMIFHTLIVNLFGVYEGLKASYGMFETVLLYFIIIPMYIMSMKPWMSVTLLRKALLLFGSGVLFFNLCIFFQLTGWGIFTNPIETLNQIYQTRMGENKTDLFGSYLWLEPQAMVLALAALITCFLFLMRRKIWIGAIALLLLLFLSFTVTKGAIFAFVLGGGMICIFIFKGLSNHYKLYTLGAIVLGGVLIALFLPKGIWMRIHETSVEIENIKVGRLEGSSLSPRIAVWQEAYKHFDDYALCGVGVYYRPIQKEWFETSPNEILVAMPNVHNSFLDYWIKGGIPGLLLVLSLFVFPLVCMKSLHQWSFLILGCLVAIFFANNTCVLFNCANSIGVLLFWLSAFYFYVKDFNALEREL